MEVIKEILKAGVYVAVDELSDGDEYKITVKRNGKITHTAKGVHYEQLPNDSDLVANDGGALDE